MNASHGKIIAWVVGLLLLFSSDLSYAQFSCHGSLPFDGSADYYLSPTPGGWDILRWNINQVPPGTAPNTLSLSIVIHVPPSVPLQIPPGSYTYKLNDEYTYIDGAPLSGSLALLLSPGTYQYTIWGVFTASSGCASNNRVEEAEGSIIVP